MDIQLSQKERMLLEDDKHLEEVCTTKYQSYAKQASDPELQQLFNKLSSEEQHHHDMIDQMLKGQQPTMNQSGSSKGQSSQQGTTPLSSGGSAKNNANDELLLSDLLATEKYVSSTYDTGVFESASPIVRQTLQHIQKEEQGHGEQLFNYMNSHGMYNVK